MRSLTTYFTSLVKGGYRGHKHPLPVTAAPPLDAQWTAKDLAHLESVVGSDQDGKGPLLPSRQNNQLLDTTTSTPDADPMNYTNNTGVSHMSHRRANGVGNDGRPSEINQSAGEADPMGYTRASGMSHMDTARQGMHSAV